MHITNPSKRVILAGSLVLLAVFALLWTGPSDGRRYIAESAVIPNPCTNVFFARTFERQVVGSIPGVVAVRAVPKLSAIPWSGVPVRTNGMVLRIIATGRTAQDAQRTANEAAMRLCQSVLKEYAVTGEICEQASSARPYSYFHDSFQPAIGRLFKH